MRSIASSSGNDALRETLLMSVYLTLTTLLKYSCFLLVSRKDIEDVVNLGTAVGLWPKSGVKKDVSEFTLFLWS